jgi:hypothetical protein
MTTKKKLLMASAGASTGALAEVEFLGAITAVSATNTNYTLFSGNFAGLDSADGVTVIAVLQSRNSGGDTSSPYSSVTIGGQSASIIGRSYGATSTDFCSSAIAYISDFDITSSINVSVSLSATHAGQANIFLYKFNSTSVATSSSNVANNVSSISTSITTPSSGFSTVVIATTSNSNSATDITSSSGSLTEDVSKDGGTTEFVTVSHSNDIPSSSVVSFTSDNGGTAETYSILVACFAET